MTVVAAEPVIGLVVVTSEGYRHVTNFHKALPEADVVTMHIAGKPHGAPVFGAAGFARMRPGPVFVNTAHSSLIDEAALAQALGGGDLRGTGLDVLRHEPSESHCPPPRLDNRVFTRIAPPRPTNACKGRPRCASALFSTPSTTG